MLSLIGYNAFAEKCTIWGIAKDYKGQQLVLKTYTDEIVFSEKELASSIVDSTGSVCFEFEINTTTTCFFELGAYHAILFVEPQKTYYIESFPFKPITKVQELDPYFISEKILLAVKTADSEELNHQIRKFENMFNYYYVKSAINTNFDSIKATIKTLKISFPQTDNFFFENYKDYKYVQLINLNEKYSPKLAISSYFSKLPASYENISFWEAFNFIFDNFFQAIDVSAEQKTLDNALTNADFMALCNMLEFTYKITDKKLQELVIIKGLYDAYFSSKRNPAHILSLVKSWKEYITFPQNITICEKIIDDLTKIAELGKPFNFTLSDEKAKPHQLTDYKDKYIYLNFCSTNIPLSKKDFGILSRYADTYKKDLCIINVFMDEEKESMNSFVAKLKNKQMINLFGENDRELFQKYQILKIPTYFLINRTGEFLLFPAPTPDEGFEQIFQEILWKEKMKNQELPKNNFW